MLINRKRMFMDSFKGVDLEGEGMVEYTTERANSLTKLVVYGITTSYSKNTYPYRNTIYHLGYNDAVEGCVCLNIRTHRENYLDAYEMERIMKDCQANFYRGQYDENSMLFKNGSGLNSSLIPYTHIKTKKTTQYFIRFNAYTEAPVEPYPNKFYTMMTFYHHNNSASSIIHPANDGGDFTLTAGSNALYTLTQIQHRRDLAYDYSYLIRYAGMSLTEWLPGENEVVEPYVGHNCKLRIPGNKFLEGLEDTDTGEFIADEYHPFSGMVIRRFERFTKVTDLISEVDIDGVKVFAIRLPKRASPRKLLHSNTFKVTKNVSVLTSTDNCMCISDDCNFLYLKLPSSVTDAEGAKSYWDKAYSEAVYLTDDTVTQFNEDKYVFKQPPGLVKFCVCGYAYPKIKLTHI